MMASPNPMSTTTIGMSIDSSRQLRAALAMSEHHGRFEVLAGFYEGLAIQHGDVRNPQEMDVHSMAWVGIAANAVVSASMQAPTDSAIRK